MFDDDFLKAIVLEMVRTGKIDLDPLPVLAKEVKTAEDPDKWADRQPNPPGALAPEGAGRNGGYSFV